MRRDLIEGGFDPPLPPSERSRQRTALSLIASIALAICIMVAATAVSIGIAQAELLGAAQTGDGSLAVAYVVCSIIVGGIIGVIYRRRQQRRD
jgi:hypothetical protein